MKKLLSFVFVSLLFTSLTIAQEAYSETRNVSGFDEIGFSVPGEVFITIGEVFKVTLEGDKDFVGKIVTKVEEGELLIKFDKWFNTGNQKVVVDITMPSLKGIGVSGSGKVVLNNSLKGDGLEVGISGSGKVCLVDVVLKELECGISGSGSLLIEGEGSVSDMEIDISGAGSYTGTETTIGTLEASISGSGSCDCTVTGLLKAAISGSGNIRYAGNPKIDAVVSGSGKVRMK